jgi:hypothetical protein
MAEESRIVLVPKNPGATIQVNGTSPFTQEKMFYDIALIPSKIFEELLETTIHLDGGMTSSPEGELIKSKPENNVLVFITDQDRMWVLDSKGNPFKIIGLDIHVVRVAFEIISPFFFTTPSLPEN